MFTTIVGVWVAPDLVGAAWVWDGVLDGITGMDLAGAGEEFIIKVGDLEMFMAILETQEEEVRKIILEIV
jgi:hypothetical protein